MLTSGNVIFFIALFAAEGFSVCLMGGKKYEIGEVWHPQLKDTENYCATCTCVETVNHSELKCESNPCRKVCNESISNECCKVCLNKQSFASDDSSFQKTYSLQSSLTQQTMAHEPKTSDRNPQGKGCFLGGRFYNHRQQFSSNFSTAENNKCQQCICNNGQAQCNTKLCEVIKCSTPTESLNDCCRICPSSSSTSDTLVSFSDQTVMESTRSQDCKSEDRYFINGATWHPVIGPFGEMDCVTCECKNGNIDCARIKCPSKKELKCDRPKKLDGHCCPSCPNEEERDEWNTDIKWKDIIANNTSGFIVCLPIISEFAVWKNQATGIHMISGYVEYAFLPMRSNPKDVIYHQIVLRHDHFQSIDIHTISREEFEEIALKSSFTLQGGTTKRLVQKLERKEKRLKKRCENSQRLASCKPDFEKLESGLKMKRPHKRVRCIRGETKL